MSAVSNPGKMAGRAVESIIEFGSKFSRDGYVDYLETLAEEIQSRLAAVPDRG